MKTIKCRKGQFLVAASGTAFCVSLGDFQLMFKLRKDLQWLFLAYNELALHCYHLYPKSFWHATAPLLEGFPASCVQLCLLRLSGRAVLVHRWDHRLKPQTGAKGNAVQELFTAYSCKMVISQQSEVFWGVGLMFSAEVLKYEIDSLGSCKEWRHWERSSVFVLRGIVIQLSLGQGSSLLRQSGDKERQQRGHKAHI